MFPLTFALLLGQVFGGFPPAGQPGGPPLPVAPVEAVKKVAAALIAIKDNEIALQKARAEFAEAALRQAGLQAEMSAAAKFLPDWCEGGQLRTDFTFLCPPKPPAPKTEAKK